MDLKIGDHDGMVVHPGLKAYLGKAGQLFGKKEGGRLFFASDVVLGVEVAMMMQVSCVFEGFATAQG